ncbi:hypothetical protein HPB51_028091 [Rhipicephalus microplus]|uniref:Helicase C-terminal domain-containing protein n=1 Tax=Rhipicephalus microplus TaxID=6941 RepID=A0A9J6CY33_RHIMP|nr:hypothetical protein HPB51_028091 [Rhipicephalus microplus]
MGSPSWVGTFHKASVLSELQKGTFHAFVATAGHLVSIAKLRGRPRREDRGGTTLGAERFGDVPVLVATGVAAGVLAVDDVRLVVNYDSPNDASDYSRRSKYVTRSDGMGAKCAFLVPDETRKELVSFLRDSKQDIPPQLSAVAKEVQRR